MSRFIFALSFLLCLAYFCSAQIGDKTGFGIASDKPLSAKDTSSNCEKKTIVRNSKNARLLIVSKPRAVYTDQAKMNNVEGVVILQITFKKSGEIGKINVINGLSDGLNEQATMAAKKIKFMPQRKNGKSVTITKNIEYNFNIY
ncbi:MAG: energy transducer TonB [Pyrinomonadaceae bacterium]